MPVLRVLSWNLRTFGTHALRDVDLSTIASIIANSRADVVCVQELMIGDGVSGGIGAPISQSSIDLIDALVIVLNAGDPKAGWVATCSGVNSGFGRTKKRMRDAYAFLVKRSPSTSKLTHDDPVVAIEPLSEPTILRQPGYDTYIGRRPGMQTFNVLTTAVTPVNIISVHAATPCNTYSKGKGAGYSITELATFPEVGGGILSSDGRNYNYDPSVMPLPQIDTIVLGDFNYSMHLDFARSDIYRNLLTNYEGCVSNAKQVRYTTYEPSGFDALRLVSAYDNIFVLLKHAKFTPALSHLKSGVIDFIAESALKLGLAIGFKYLDDPTVPTWYVIHKDLYKKQHASVGISDHLPVWSDFDVGTGKGQTASKILPTSGADNNCLFHAVYGLLSGGQYVDVNAAARRTLLVNTLGGYGVAKAFPSAAIRDAVLQAMVSEFDGNPGALVPLRVLLANTVDPFTVGGFLGYYQTYVQSITTGRMLWVAEAELVAIQQNITINLWYVNRGQYFQQILNVGRPNPVSIYHQALHYQRWQP